ncbi:proline-specific peptidase [Roridomyces roridus]|uniref:Proline-specific peptidase n=1 Tax=Roridomyces roridus TaxID=1738132 RepID=A0AAD7BJM3_9AGAR|nr:proline-specific peptidase [Roridomyces roridus]
MEPVTGTIDFAFNGETFKTAYKIFGDLKAPSSPCPLLVLHGGPAIPHQYLLTFSALASKTRPVIFYDQVGGGLSTHLPDKPAEFWTVEMFMTELDNVIAQLLGGPDTVFDLAGHSWGGMMGSNYVISRNPPGLRRLILADAPASMELWSVGTNSLLNKFPTEFRDMLKKHESEGTTESEEYQNGIQAFNEKHLCTVKPWPADLMSAFDALGQDPTVYAVMIGPSEFNITGTLGTWTVINDLHKISVPTLLINGKEDDAQDVSVTPFFERIPKVKWVQFAESSHMPFFEERERFLQVVGEFLDA